MIVNTSSVIWNPNTGYIQNFVSGASGSDFTAKDYAGNPKQVAGIGGWDGTYVQAAPVCFAPLSFDFISAIRTDAYTTDFIDARRLSSVVVSALFTDSSGSITVHKVSRDKNNFQVVTDTVQIPAIAHQDSNGYYFGKGTVLNSTGARELAFIVEAPTVGSASFSFGVI